MIKRIMIDVEAGVVQAFLEDTAKQWNIDSEDYADVKSFIEDKLEEEELLNQENEEI